MQKLQELLLLDLFYKLLHRINRLEAAQKDVYKIGQKVDPGKDVNRVLTPTFHLIVIKITKLLVN